MRDILVGVGLAAFVFFMGALFFVGLLRPDVVIYKIRRSEVFFYGREISQPGPSWLIRVIGGVGTILALAMFATILRVLFK